MFKATIESESGDGANIQVETVDQLNWLIEIMPGGACCVPCDDRVKQCENCDRYYATEDEVTSGRRGFCSAECRDEAAERSSLLARSDAASDHDYSMNF